MRGFTWHKGLRAPAKAGAQGCVALSSPGLLPSQEHGIVKLLMVYIAIIVAALAAPLAASPNYAHTQLADPVKESEAKALMESLRCIQCQGQSIADSDADMAATMRAEVRRQIDAGKSSDAVRRWMIERYGEWVSFEPSLRGAGLLLWIAPLLILGIALLVARSLFDRKKT